VFQEQLYNGVISNVVRNLKEYGKK